MRVREALGMAAIETVAVYLRGRGYQVLDRKWACPDGEIAVVAADRRTLIACEVRVFAGTRTRAPLEAMNDARKRQLRKAAAAWLAGHGMRRDQVRVDVVGLSQDDGGFTIEHVKGVA